MARIGSFAAVACLMLLSACGGGGGGGSSGFTLEANSANFTAHQGTAPPAQRSISVRLDDSQSTYLGAGYRDGVVPEWLDVSILGSAPNFTLVLRITSTELTARNYDATLTVGTANENGDILQTRDIAVSYNLKGRAYFFQENANWPFVYGNADDSRNVTLSVRGDARNWSARSNSSWLLVPSGSFSAPTGLAVTIDASELLPGNHDAVITLEDPASDGPPSTTTITAAVSAPTLTVPPIIRIGGTEGRDDAPVALPFSINTGERQHPWTLSLSTSDGVNWLRADRASGSVGNAGDEVLLSGVGAAVRGGVHDGTARVEVDVDGYQVSANVPVTFGKEAERLYALSEGVALTHLPDRQLLARDVPVGSTLDRIGVPWTASSTATWLQVTPSGVTGEAISLVANPDGLASDRIHYADVTLLSDDPSIETGATIRVGLWIGSDAAAELALPVDSSSSSIATAASPVEPLVYIHVRDSAYIDVYNTYTGNLERQLVAPASFINKMIVRGDGSTLYAADRDMQRIYALDPETGDLQRTFSYDTGQPDIRGIAYARPSGLSTILTGDGWAFDADTGASLVTTPFVGTLESGAVVAASDSRAMYVFTKGLSRSVLGRYEIARPALMDGALLVRHDVSKDITSYGRDLAVSPDGSRVYIAAGSSYGFPSYDGSSFAPAGVRPGTAATSNNVDVAWNGTFVGGADARYPDAELYIYSAAGSELAESRCTIEGYAARGLAEDSVVFSGDGLRLICVSRQSGGNSLMAFVKNTP